MIPPKSQTTVPCPISLVNYHCRTGNREEQIANLIVPSPEADRCAGKGSRTIPLFAELRPYLLEAAGLAEPGQTHVVGGKYLAAALGPKGWRNCNLRTQFERLIRKAGLEPWPRLFHNLRSSRETELLEHFPAHVVAAWMGHDVKVSLQHYAQVTDEHFERAVTAAEGVRLSAVPAGGAKSDAVVAQNAAQSGVVRGGYGMTELPQVVLNQDVMHDVALAGNMVHKSLAERAGFEPAEGFWPLAALAKRCFQPLSHLSTLSYSLSSPASEVKTSLAVNRWFAEDRGETCPNVRDQPMLQFARHPPDVWPQRQLAKTTSLMVGGSGVGR